MPELTIVMYHYVRDVAHSRFPELKALDFSRFRAQLDHIERRYRPVAAGDVAAALQGGPPLPEDACLLTFDDGYLDHYTFAFPELFRRGLPGAFYPPVLATRRTGVMEVNKIQIILAQNGYANAARLPELVRAAFREAVPDPAAAGVDDFETLYAAHARPSRFDCAEVMFVKAMLQYALPPQIRTRMINALFSSVVGVDEEMLAQELYLSEDMLRVMAGNGMHIGSHGDRHRWIDRLEPAGQAQEIDASLDMLRRVYGTPDFVWSMCYPFGGTNDSVQRICAERGCAFAVTTVPEVARPCPENRLFLPRLDTNDLPPARPQ